MKKNEVKPRDAAGDWARIRLIRALANAADALDDATVWIQRGGLGFGLIAQIQELKRKIEEKAGEVISAVNAMKVRE